jgi:hypothetical protein
LPFIVAATAIGQSLNLMDAAEASALIAAGLMSVLIFPVTGLSLLKRAMRDEGGSGAGRHAALATDGDEVAEIVAGAVTPAA